MIYHDLFHERSDMTVKQEVLRMPGKKEIGSNRVFPPDMLRSPIRVSSTETVYPSGDGKHRVVDAIKKSINVRILSLDASLDGKKRWVTIMEVRERKTHKGGKAFQPILLFTSIDDNGNTSTLKADAAGRLRNIGAYGHSPESAKKDQYVKSMISLGLYHESSLPSRVDVKATMENFFNVVRSGKVTQPQIVALP